MKLVVTDQPNALKEGDVLIKKTTEGADEDEKLIVNVQTKVKSAYMAVAPLFGRIKKAVGAAAMNPKYMHVAMYVGDGKVVEESRDGLVWHEPDESAQRYAVWRYCRNDDTGARAAQIMRIWAGATDPSTGEEEKDTARNVFGKKLLVQRDKLKRRQQYGGTDWKSLKGLMFSSPAFLPQIFGSSSPGLFSLLSRAKHKFLGWQGTMICSEAVIAAYQLAADERALLVALNSPIKLDPHRTSPMKLQQWLMDRFLSKGGHWKWQYEIFRHGGAWHGVPVAGTERERKWRQLWAA